MREETAETNIVVLHRSSTERNWRWYLMSPVYSLERDDERSAERRGEIQMTPAQGQKRFLPFSLFFSPLFYEKNYKKTRWETVRVLGSRDHHQQQHWIVQVEWLFLYSRINLHFIYIFLSHKNCFHLKKKFHRERWRRAADSLLQSSHLSHPPSLNLSHTHFPFLYIPQFSVSWDSFSFHSIFSPPAATTSHSDSKL